MIYREFSYSQGCEIIDYCEDNHINYNWLNICEYLQGNHEVIEIGVKNWDLIPKKLLGE